MNNVITNSKVAISDWISPNYEKKSISKERNITLYKRMKKRFLVFDIVMPFNSGFLVAAIILWAFCSFDKVFISYVLILSITVIVNVSLNELSEENAEINKITYITNARSGDITTAIVEYYKEVK